MADRVPDQSRPFFITVRRRHFSGAQRQKTHHCLLAVAIREQFPDLLWVSVSSFNAHLAANSGPTVEWYHDGYRLTNDFDGGRLCREDFPREGVRVRFSRDASHILTCL